MDRRSDLETYLMGRRPTYYAYTVIGNGFDFPLDMLRHDHAWPRDEHNLPGRYRRLELPEEIRILGVRYPTVGRWQSFGWSVRDIEPWDEPYTRLPAPKVRIDAALSVIEQSEGKRPGRGILRQISSILRGKSSR